MRIDSIIPGDEYALKGYGTPRHVRAVEIVRLDVYGRQVRHVRVEPLDDRGSVNYKSDGTGANPNVVASRNVRCPWAEHAAADAKRRAENEYRNNVRTRIIDALDRVGVGRNVRLITDRPEIYVVAGDVDRLLEVLANAAAYEQETP